MVVSLEGSDVMTDRRTKVIALVFLVATALIALQATAADPPYVREGALAEVSFDEDGYDTTLNLNDVFDDDDPEDGKLTYTYFEVEGVSITIDEATGEVNISGDEDWNGKVTVTFRAWDSREYFAEHRINVTVAPVNDAPEARGKIARESWRDGTDHQFNVSAFFTDADGDTLFYYVEWEPDAVSITNRHDDHRNPMFDIVPVDPEFYGYIQITFTVYDKDPETHPEEALSANQTAIFEVKTDRPPEMVTSFLPDTTEVHINETETMEFRVLGFSTTDVDDWRYEWRVDGVTVVDLGPPVFELPIPANEDEAYNTSGEHEVFVMCHRDWEHPEYEMWGVRWTVHIHDVNRPPVITFVTGNQTLSPGDEVNLQVVAHDPDVEDLDYTWYRIRDRGGNEEIGTSDRVTYSEDLPPGRYSFQCDVGDGKDTTQSDPVVITVEEVDGPAGLVPTLALVALAVFFTLLLVARRRWKDSKAY
jgi:hypothetical protein